MGDTTIQWTGRRAPDGSIIMDGKTFNGWWGCTEEKGSPACGHCYARTFSKRLGLDIWGDDKPRRFFGDKHWDEPLHWNKAAQQGGYRIKVFCASMSDVFEDRAELIPQRARLFNLIQHTPHLDWLLLTKRIDSVKARLEELAFSSGAYPEGHDFAAWWLGGSAPENIWLGTTVEDQSHLWRAEHLSRIAAKYRFLSIEPLLGPLDLVPAIEIDMRDLYAPSKLNIHWVIVGGESGAGARPMQLDWARTLRDQCHSAGIAYFMKQLGGAKDKRGAFEDFPEDLRVRQFPDEAR